MLPKPASIDRSESVDDADAAAMAPRSRHGEGDVRDVVRVVPLPHEHNRRSQEEDVRSKMMGGRRSKDDDGSPIVIVSGSSSASSPSPPLLSDRNNKLNTSLITINADLPDPSNSLASNISQVSVHFVCFCYI